MTITIIIPTGEKRPPKLGEYFMDDKGAWGVAVNDWQVTVFDIGVAHQVEVPDNVTFLIPTWGCYAITKDSVPLPRPKKLIKKWQWLVGTRDALKGGEVYVPHGYWDRATATEFWGSRWICQPILETEMEVEVKE